MIRMTPRFKLRAITTSLGLGLRAIVVGAAVMFACVFNVAIADVELVADLNPVLLDDRGNFPDLVRHEGKHWFVSPDAVRRAGEIWWSDGETIQRDDFSSQALEALHITGSSGGWLYIEGRSRSTGDYGLWRVSDVDVELVTVLDCTNEDCASNALVRYVAPAGEATVIALRTPGYLQYDVFGVAHASPAAFISLGRFRITTPGAFVPDRDKVWFATARTSTVGSRLWTTDGTVAGTLIVTESEESTRVISGRLQVVEEGAAYYSVRDTATRVCELWRASGDTRAVDKVDTLTPSSPYCTDRLIKSGNRVLYYRRVVKPSSGANRIELVRYNTQLQTGRVVASFVITRPGSEASDDLSVVSNLHTARGRLWFMVREAGRTQIWTSRGAQSSSVGLVPARVSLKKTGVVADQYFFIGTRKEARNEIVLGLSDGSEDGTRVVIDATFGDPQSALRNRLDLDSGFPAYSASDIIGDVVSSASGTALLWYVDRRHGEQLYSLNLETDRFTRLSTFARRSIGSDGRNLANRFSGPPRMVVDNDTLFVCAVMTDGYAIYAIDTDTRRSRRIARATECSFFESGGEDLLYFVGPGKQIWQMRKDGSSRQQFSTELTDFGFKSEGVRFGNQTYIVAGWDARLLRLDPDRRRLVEVDERIDFPQLYGKTENKLWLLSSGAESFQSGIWSIDTRSRATRHPTSGFKEILGFTELNGELYILGRHGDSPRGLYRGAQTEQGEPVFIAAVPSSEFNVRKIHALDGVMYFAAGGRQTSIWRSDGTTAGTEKIRSGLTDTRELVTYDNALWYGDVGELPLSASGAPLLWRLMRVDGSGAQEVMHSEPNPRADARSLLSSEFYPPRYYQSTPDGLYFFATRWPRGSEPMRYR